MPYAVRCDGSAPVDLATIDPRGDDSIEKDEGEHQLKALVKELGDLQELLFAARTHALLIVLQGMDTSGKDGTIRVVLDDMDPPGVQVSSFKVPTEEERSHDFLWRHHVRTPALSIVGVFNRSYYEAVVVEKVKKIAPPDVIVSRYPHINDFELLLAQSHTIMAKFFLHITEEVQLARLLERQKEPEKWWKLSLGDWQERERWGAYMEAYQAAINATSTMAAPWYIVPADRKWLRDLAVAQTLVDLLRPYRDGWLDALRERGNLELAALREAGFPATLPKR